MRKQLYIAAYHQSKFGKLLGMTVPEILQRAATETIAQVGADPAVARAWLLTRRVDPASGCSARNYAALMRSFTRSSRLVSSRFGAWSRVRYVSTKAGHSFLFTGASGDTGSRSRYRAILPGAIPSLRLSVEPTAPTTAVFRLRFRRSRSRKTASTPVQ